jgi:hypothetical protein
MCVTVDMAISKNHLAKYTNQIVCYFFGVQAQRLNLLLIVYFDTLNELHCNQSRSGHLAIIFWDMHDRFLIFKELCCSLSIIDFVCEV